MATKLSAVEQIVLELCRENAHVSTAVNVQIVHSYMPTAIHNRDSHAGPISRSPTRQNTRDH